MIEGLVSRVARLESLRGFLADAIGLRWAHVGRFDPVVPVAMALVLVSSGDQLGKQIGGLPFGLLWAAAAVPGTLALRATRAGRRYGWLGSALVAGILASWVLYDIWFWGHTNQLYDLNVYLGSADRWLHGGQPYLTAPLVSWPPDPRSDFLLYPPPLLPLFGVLSMLPQGPVAVGWTCFLVACAYSAYRLLGLPRFLSVALLAFPPVANGFASGNVASLTFLLFAAGARTGGTLVVDSLFKVQTGLPALWLIRQRRWRAILTGAAIVAAICLATLPLVGLDSWRAWWDGLGYRAVSQANVPSLYGHSYAAILPASVFVALAVAAVAVALLFRGRSGLAALGLASIFASPSLWPHGFAFALPAVLMLEDGAAVWLVLGTGAFRGSMWNLAIAGWVALLAARRFPSGRLHPLTGSDGPWPSATPPSSSPSPAGPAQPPPLTEF